MPRLLPPRVRRRAAAAAVALAALGTTATAQAPAHAVDTANFDRALRLQDDSSRFVNGRWLARTAIPADRPSWASFYEPGRPSPAGHQELERRAGASLALCGR